MGADGASMKLLRRIFTNPVGRPSQRRTGTVAGSAPPAWGMGEEDTQDIDLQTPTWAVWFGVRPTMAYQHPSCEGSGRNGSQKQSGPT